MAVHSPPHSPHMVSGGFEMSDVLQFEHYLVRVLVACCPCRLLAAKSEGQGMSMISFLRRALMISFLRRALMISLLRLRLREARVDLILPCDEDAERTLGSELQVHPYTQRTHVNPSPA